MSRRGLRWIMRLIPVAAVIAAVAWLWMFRVDVTSIPQQALHDEATVSTRVALTKHPAMHKVVIEPLPADRVLSVLASYLPPPLGSGGKTEMQGYYDPSDGSIRITGGLARLSAAMPNDTLRSFFDRALRHEYGHAFLDDWLKTKKGGDKVWAASAKGPQQIDPASVPAELQGPLSEYTAMSTSAYGQQYFMSSFGEFMAESYARLLFGQEVPPKTEQFLMASAGK
jgi:hypothetical protein